LLYKKNVSSPFRHTTIPAKQLSKEQELGNYSLMNQHFPNSYPPFLLQQMAIPLWHALLEELETLEYGFQPSPLISMALLQYMKIPNNLPIKCDGCNSDFSVGHAHQCKKGGLVTRHHDEINYELANLMRLALKKSTVKAEPQTFNGSSAATSTNPSPIVAASGELGDLLVRKEQIPGALSQATACFYTFCYLGRRSTWI
jgi:hypothetical protein